MDNILECLEPVLANYTVVNTHVSKKKTMYITLLNSDNRYLQFRLSTHTHKYSYYSNKSFILKEKQIDVLLSEIEEYLKKASWHNFTYNDFFVISLFENLKTNSINFFIDNTFNFFEENLGGLIIYQENIFQKDRFFNIASTSMTKQIRKLFATGLMSSFPLDDNIFRIYITKSGVGLASLFKETFSNQFYEDLKNIDWQYIKIPKKD